MRHGDLDGFLDRAGGALRQGPLAVIMAEDAVEVGSTLRHHLGLGFRSVLLLAPPDLDLPGSELPGSDRPGSGMLTADRPESDRPDTPPALHRIDHDVFAPGALPAALNRLAAAAPGQWLYGGYNAEYLFFPFCETRNVRELLAFHAEERREAMLCFVIDLYAADAVLSGNAVSLAGAHLDGSGYHAEPRKDAASNWQPRDRQQDFYGGLRWRFEEHVPWDRRRIDRIALFRAKAGVTMRPDFTFSEEEWNTTACPWHNNLTAAVCSFRAAKALRTNPGSRQAIGSFRWHGSLPFQWHSRQLMDLGLMEPGQWF